MSHTERKSRTFYPALRGVFGDWIFYSCLMSAGDVAKKLSIADVIHPSKGLSTLIQRQLKGARAAEIGDYLTREQQRFFNSMVVAVYGGSPTWHGFSNFRPQSEDISLQDVPEEAEDSVGFLSFSGTEKMFALDGQHRLAGIRNALSRDESLKSENVSLLVVAHHNTKAGLERTRRLFTDVEADTGYIPALDVGLLVHDQGAEVPRVEHEDVRGLGRRVELHERADQDTELFLPVLRGRFGRSQRAYRLYVYGRYIFVINRAIMRTHCGPRLPRRPRRPAPVPATRSQIRQKVDQLRVLYQMEALLELSHPHPSLDRLARLESEAASLNEALCAIEEQI